MNHDELEQIVMNKLLEGNTDILAAFRTQYAQATVMSREFTGCGFFTTFNVPAHLSIGTVKGKINDVEALFPNNEEYFFILYISDGKIKTLEGYGAIDNDWKNDYNGAEVLHFHDDKRVYELFT